MRIERALVFLLVSNQLFAASENTFPVRGRAKLSLFVHSCRVTLRGTSLDRIKWSPVRKQLGQEPLEAVQEPKISFRGDGDDLSLSIRGASEDKAIPSVVAGGAVPSDSLKRCQVELGIPRSISVRALASGYVDLEIVDLRGHSDFRVNRGNIILKNISPERGSSFSFFCLNCALNAERLSGDLDLHVSSGATAVSNSTVKRLSVSAYDGSIVLEQVGGEVHTQTRGGQIVAKGLDGDFSFLTKSGNVDFVSGKALKSLQGNSETGKQQILIGSVILSASVLQSQSGQVEVAVTPQFRGSVQLRSRPDQAEIQIPQHDFGQWQRSQESAAVVMWRNRRSKGAADLEISVETGKLKFFEKK